MSDTNLADAAGGTTPACVVIATWAVVTVVATVAAVTVSAST